MRDKSWIFDILILGITFIFLNGLYLGHMPLFVPDGARYAEIPREMLSNGNFITPHLNGVIYFEKPPFFYWLVALYEHLFGFSEWAIRSCTLTLHTLTCIFTYVFARKLFCRRTGIVSSLILATTLLFFAINRINTIDVCLTFFLTLSLFSFLLGLNKKGATQKWLLWLAYFCAGCAMMTKGLIGVLFPIMIVGLWLIIQNEWATLKRMRIISGLMIIMAINAPWVILIQIQNPEFFHQYFINQQILRFSTPVADRGMNVFLYLSLLFLGLFPWVVLLPQAIKNVISARWHKKNTHDTLVFLLIWPLSIYIFFAFSHSKLVTYLLPLMPPLSVLIGVYCAKFWDTRASKTLKISMVCLSVISLVLAICFYIIPLIVFGQATPEAYHLLIYITAAFLLLGIIPTSLCFVKYNKLAFLSLAGLTFAAYIGIWLAYPVFSPYSIKPFAIKINNLLKKNPGAIVVSYHEYFQDLPYYTQQRVYLVGTLDELDFGYYHQKDAKNWILYGASGIRRYKALLKKHSAYIVTSQNTYQQMNHKQYQVIMQNPQNVLLQHQPSKAERPTMPKDQKYLTESHFDHAQGPLIQFSL